MEILVLFASKGGNTYELAKGVAAGIEEVEGVSARIRRVRETTPIEVIRANDSWSRFHDYIAEEVPEATLDDLTQTEGLAMGSPTRYGNLVPAMGNFLEGTGPLWVTGALVGKPAGVFGSTSTLHGGNESTLLTMMIPLMHLGYIIVPLGFTDPGVMSTTRGGTPYGPTSVSGTNANHPPDELELHLSKVFGKRLAGVARKLRG